MDEAVFWTHVEPKDIEAESFRMIGEELGGKGIVLPDETAPVVMRVIHTTADFSYAETMTFKNDAVRAGLSALRGGARIVTDTQMAYSGINKGLLSRYGCEAHCYIADEEVAKEAALRESTRSAVAMEKGALLSTPVIFAVGNAPTALKRIHELIGEGLKPALVIGVPVGFVNVEAAKELILEDEVPMIVNRGRKGGSNVAAAIVNALLYTLRDADRT